MHLEQLEEIAAGVVAPACASVPPAGPSVPPALRIAPPITPEFDRP